MCACGRRWRIVNAKTIRPMQRSSEMCVCVCARGTPSCNVCLRCKKLSAYFIVKRIRPFRTSRPPHARWHISCEDAHARTRACESMLAQNRPPFPSRSRLLSLATHPVVPSENGTTIPVRYPAHLHPVHARVPCNTESSCVWVCAVRCALRSAAARNASAEWKRACCEAYLHTENDIITKESASGNSAHARIVCTFRILRIVGARKPTTSPPPTE